MKFGSRPSVALATTGVLCVGLTACATGNAESADSIPKRVEVIVPWAAGGGSDQATRQLLNLAEEPCETTFVVSNRTGAAGATGHAAGADAEPDGTTLTDMTAEVMPLPYLGNSDVSYEDFTPIVRFASISPAFAVPADSEFESMEDVADALNAGESVRIGTTGPGGMWDVAAGGFEEAAGVKFTERVPYDGGASIVQALLGGHLEIANLAVAEVQPHVESGDLKVLAIADDEPAAVMPEVPTLQDLGYDFSTRTWFSFVGPAGLPEGQVDAFAACFQEAWESDDYQAFLANQGINPAFLGTEEFESFLSEEDAMIADLVPRIYGDQ